LSSARHQPRQGAERKHLSGDGLLGGAQDIQQLPCRVPDALQGRQSIGKRTERLIAIRVVACHSLMAAGKRVGECRPSADLIWSYGQPDSQTGDIRLRAMARSLCRGTEGPRRTCGWNCAGLHHRLQLLQEDQECGARNGTEGESEGNVL
jgi:hypothetical protein